MSDSIKTGRVDTAATAAAVGALACWSTGPIFLTYLTGYVDSWTQNTLRYSVACLFWLPFLLYVIWTGAFDRRTWLLAIPPALANIVMQSLYAAGFYYIGPAFLTLLSNSSVLWVAGFSLLLFPEERSLVTSGRFWAALLLSLAGLFGVVYFREGFSPAGTQIGILLALLQGLMWGVYTIAVRVAFKNIDSRSGFSVISIYTVAGLWLCTSILGSPREALHLGAQPWLAVVFSSVTGIALAHVLYYAAIKRIGATLPMLIVLAQPLVVFSLSSVIFHERLTGLQLLSGVVLLLGSALSIWAQQHLRSRRTEE